MHILITGAARGIGRHLTLALTQKGHRVFLVDNNAHELAHTLELLRERSPVKPHGTATAPSSSPSLFNEGARSVDLASLTQLKGAVEEARAFFDGRLDLLVNNAMALPHTWPGDVSVDDSTDEGRRAVEAHWERQVAVGLTAPFHLSRLLAGMLAHDETSGKEGGSIVNVSSTRAWQAEEGHEGYSAVKAGLLGLSQSLAVSLGAKHRIRVNSLVLGWVHVENEREGADSKPWNEGITEVDQAWHPSGRVGMGEDVLKAVEYLAGAKWVTGTEMVLDGGVTRKMVYPE